MSRARKKKTEMNGNSPGVDVGVSPGALAALQPEFSNDSQIITTVPSTTGLQRTQTYIYVQTCAQSNAVAFTFQPQTEVGLLSASRPLHKGFCDVHSLTSSGTKTRSGHGCAHAAREFSDSNRKLRRGRRDPESRCQAPPGRCQRTLSARAARFPPGAYGRCAARDGPLS